VECAITKKERSGFGTNLNRGGFVSNVIWFGPLKRSSRNRRKEDRGLLRSRGGSQGSSTMNVEAALYRHIRKGNRERCRRPSDRLFKSRDTAEIVTALAPSMREAVRRER